MKKTFLLTLSLTILILTSGAPPLNNFNQTVAQEAIVSIDESNVISRPMFVNITDGNSAKIRDRNETLGNGAIYSTDINKNVTITYRIMNGNNETEIFLYADVPGNYSLTESTNNLKFKYVTSIYENISTPYNGNEYVNVSVAYFEVEFNMTTSIVPFFAGEALPSTLDNSAENFDNSPVNLLTTNQYWDVYTDDLFYLQEEDLVFNLVANNSDTVDVFGIKYIKDGESPEFLNFTVVAATNYVANISIGKFDPDTVIVMSSYVYINDTVQNETRIIENVDVQVIEIVDGAPQITSTILSNHKDSKLMKNTFYTQNETITFNFSSTVAKGEITNFYLNITGELTLVTINPTANQSRFGAYVNVTIDLAKNQETNVSIIAETDKGLEANQTYTIVVDDTKPQFTGVEFDVAGGVRTIVTKTGEVTFVFGFNDATSDIYEAILDLDNGVAYDVKSMDNFTYVFTGIEDKQEFLVTLTIFDYAGNSDVRTIVVSIQMDAPDEEASVSTFFGFIFALALIVVLFFFPKIYDFVTEKLGR
ncbi:MAG: hypothetical protein INQ03_14865 [Candidatus Heimdallarchaeota archaeon]|nr:hypothetical protein [Candidatus Heimdallarchaeota archaeon]